MSDERVPHVLRGEIAANAIRNEGLTANPAIRGVLVGEIEKYVDSRTRKLILCWLFGDPFQPLHQISMKELADHQVLAIREWVGSVKVGEEWLPDPRFESEVKWMGWEVERLYNEQQGIVQDMLLPGGMADAALNELGGELARIDPPTFNRDGQKAPAPEPQPQPVPIKQSYYTFD